ncbi:hypothetical protein [Bacillus salacetis]|nr:hypothetical protein [Bacillus salacetis]
MADKKKPTEERERNRTINQNPEDDRHNENARAAANLAQEYPRINTDNL